jgi:hypothetical protein
MEVFPAFALPWQQAELKKENKRACTATNKQNTHLARGPKWQQPQESRSENHLIDKGLDGMAESQLAVNGVEQLIASLTTGRSKSGASRRTAS